MPSPNLRYAIAQYSFDDTTFSEQLPTTSQDIRKLDLLIGDRICICGELDGWGFGRKFDDPRNEFGVFPLSCVEFVGQPLIVSTTDGILVGDEIAKVANEWWTKIKELLITTTEIYGFEELMESFNELFVIKRKIESGGIPSEELSKLRIRVAKLIDRGNMLLGLDVIIRDDRGAPLDADSLTLLRNYEAHITSQKLVNAEFRDKNEIGHFGVMLSIKSVELHSKHQCEISITLYDLEKKIFATDSYVFLWNPNTNRHADLNLKALFADFSREDIISEKRYVMVTRVVNIAPIESNNATIRKYGGDHITPQSYFCRQSYAFDILEVSFQSQNFEPKERVIFLNRDSLDLSTALKAFMITNRFPKNLGNDMESKILISTQMISGNSTEVKARHPHLFSRSPTAILKRVDRSSMAIDDPRNELYVTLLQGELSGKSSDRNIEARLNVVESNGNVLSNIFETTTVSGTQLATIYKSVVLYHTDKPQWTEPIKLILPNSASHDVYLRILFYSKKSYDKNKTEKGPFALGYIQLIHNAGLISDSEHELVVYKIENAQNFDDETTVYMGLPTTRKTLKDSGYSKPHAPGFSLSEKSFVMISTRACSTQLTQNEHLLNVLRWRMNCVNLHQSLSELSQPIGETEYEMVRFQSHLLDALFEIWHDRETIEKLVFDVIVAVLRLCEEQRHLQAARMFETYLRRFSFTTAALKILKCLNEYVTNEFDDNTEKARNAFKVMGSLFKIIVASRKCGIRFGDCENFEKRYKEYLRELMKSMVILMGEKESKKMTIQNTCLKNIPQIIDLIYESESSSADVLCGFILDLMKNFGANIVTRERLGFIAQIVETRFFSLAICRDLLLMPCAKIGLEIIELDNLAIEKGEFADRAAEFASVVAAILERLFNESMKTETGERELTEFILAVYRPLVQAMIRVIHDDKHTDDDARGHFFSVILALLDKMSAQMFDKYVELRPFDVDKRDFLIEMSQMIRDLLNRTAFPATWKDMLILQNKVIHKALRFVMSAVQKYFADDKFCPEVWYEYMMTVVSFVTQEGLNSRHEWVKHQDEDTRVQLRKGAAKDLRSMWFGLSLSQKLLYIPSMVGSFMKVSLVDDDETRDATIPIFFDMMQSEFNTSKAGSFNKFASELVSQLDTLVGEHSATKAFKEQFRQLSLKLCQSDKELMSNGGEELIERIDRLLTLLIEYYEVATNTECVDNLMSRIVQLMRYYDQYNHEELYVKYIYKLYTLHMSYGNNIEAAKSLLRHSNMIKFDNTKLPDWLEKRNLHRGSQTHQELKEKLLQEAGSLFSQGEDWEDAISVLSELVPVYENVMIDYAKLADLMQKIAKLYTSIDTNQRVFFYYYLVAFYGKGFPDYLNGHKFIFHSDKSEMHGDFTQRIMKMYENPTKIMNTDDNSNLINSPGKFIQVFNVEPVIENLRFENNPSINPLVKLYHRKYNIKTFEHSKMEERKETKWTNLEGHSEFMRNWLVKRRLEVAESLPADLTFSEIIKQPEPIYVSPLQYAVEQMRKKNKELSEMATTVEYNPKYDLKLLSRDILGVSNASVMGGVKNYEIFFTDECRNICECGEQSVIMELSSLIIEQVEILEYCCYIHSIRCSTEDSRQINEMMADAFDRHKNYVEKTFGNIRSRLPPGTSIRRRSSFHDSNLDLNTSMGDVSGMSTIKSTRAAVKNLLSSNKRSSGNVQMILQSRSMSASQTPTFDNISSAFRSSFGATKMAKSAPPPPPPPQSESPAPSVSPISFDGIRMRPHLASQTSLISYGCPPPLPPREEIDPNRTLKRNQKI
ncbi:unnamed protein product [Caenorhabditis angaria]|uniref:Uncharacterized protein n=1 Tax=Caenorhabditis angaria TaxID=860376 RepID=A0A9P1N3K6_9PELO|nr:unnamed protein product [Caenorhabditis angaria]